MANGFEKFIKFGNTDDNNEVFGEGLKNNATLNPNEIFSPEDGIVTPDLGPKRREGSKPVIVVIDDDVPTLDLMKIYMQREYECNAFSNPKDAIFFMNQVLPDVIFIDSYMTIVDTRKMIEIIKSYKVMENIPIFYIVDAEERKVFQSRRDLGIRGVISRPVARGELQHILDSLELVNAPDVGKATGGVSTKAPAVNMDKLAALSFDDDDDDDEDAVIEEKPKAGGFSFDDDDDDDDDKGFGVFD